MASWLYTFAATLATYPHSFLAFPIHCVSPSFFHIFLVFLFCIFCFIRKLWSNNNKRTSSSRTNNGNVWEEINHRRYPNFQARHRT